MDFYEYYDWVLGDPIFASQATERWNKIFALSFWRDAEDEDENVEVDDDYIYFDVWVDDDEDYDE